MFPFLVAFFVISGAWTPAPGLNEPRAEVAAAVLDGRIYTAGGFDARGADLSSLEVFDSGAAAWQTRAPMPQGLNHLGMAALDGLVYVAGGSVGGTPTNGLFAYDPRDDSWS